MTSRAIRSFDDIEPKSLNASVICSLVAELFSLKSFLAATRIVIAMYSFVESESPGLDSLVVDVDVSPE